MNIWLVHCAGKVASVSITKALVRAGMAAGDSRVFKTHVLNRDTLSRAGARTGSGGHLAASEEFLDLYTNRRFDKCTVIVGTRDPVGQALSAFFQNILDFTGKEVVSEEDSDTVLSILPGSIIGLLDFITVTWWKQELRDVFGVDLLDVGFDRESGITVKQESEKLTFVLYTLEKGLQQLPSCLEQLSGRTSIALPHVNTVSDPGLYKPYANRDEIGRLYKIVRGKFRLPRDLLQEVYSRTMPTFFYDEEQIREFIARWQQM